MTVNKIDNIQAMSAIATLSPDIHAIIRKNPEIGREHPKLEEIRIQEKLEEERKTVQPIYSAKGQLIEYSNSGRHLDVKA